MENDKIFADIEDVDREILLRIPDDNNLFKACSLSTYTQKLCNNYFWRQRFIRKYNVNMDKVDQDAGTKFGINYRELYRKLMDRSKNEILIYGAKKGHLGLIKEMIGKGADIHARYDGALLVAAKNAHLEVVKYLIEKSVDIHESSLDDYDGTLRVAAEAGHLEVVKYLIENSADTRANYDGAVRHAAANGRLEVVKYLIKNGADNNIALGPAAQFGQLEVIKYLIENGTNIHADNDVALRHAAGRNAHLEVVKYLLEKGANWKKIRYPSQQVQLLIKQYSKDW